LANALDEAGINPRVAMPAIVAVASASRVNARLLVTDPTFMTPPDLLSDRPTKLLAPLQVQS
jgi:hypothetical protein